MDSRDFRYNRRLAQSIHWPLPLTDAEQIRVAYLANKNWRDRFPEALSSPDEAAAFVRFLGTTESGLSAPLRTWCAGCDPDLLSPALTSSGVNLFGHFSYPSGLRTSIESIVSGLHASCMKTSLRDVRVNARTDEPVHDKFAGLELFDTSIIHVQPEPFFDVAISRSGLQEGSPRRYRIGYWYLEFDTIPASWDKAAASCDELWTATSFIAHGLRARYRHPVYVFMPGLELPEIHSLPRDRFDLPKDSFVFLFTFHMSSVMERKNPLGLIAAFRRALLRAIMRTSSLKRHSAHGMLVSCAGCMLQPKVYACESSTMCSTARKRSA